MFFTQYTQDEEGEDDEEFIDIDTEEIFTALAKGKEFLTFADLKEWDLLKEMKEAGDMSDSQLKDILKAAGKYAVYSVRDFHFIYSGDVIRLF
jgi:hypothetical protein